MDRASALLHLSDNFLLRGRSPLSEPLMEDNIGKGKSLERLEGKHAGDEVLEGGAELTNRVVLLVKAPKLVVITAANVLVVWVLLSRLLEGEGASEHDKEDDSDGK